MVKKVKCPKCLAKNSLPIEHTIHPTKGFVTDVWACTNCGAEMDGKEYTKLLNNQNNKCKKKNFI